MPDAAQTGLLLAREVARTVPLEIAANGLHYASFGYTEVPADSLKQIVEAVPPRVAASLDRHAYYFVPLAIGESDEIEVARGFTADLGDRATCHRNLVARTALADSVECTFISARLMQDRFALAFEFFINVGHQVVDAGTVPRAFQALVWAQARAAVRGETSQDAYEARNRSLETSGTSVNQIQQAAAIDVGSLPSRPESGNGMSLFASREPQPLGGSIWAGRSSGISARVEAARAENVRASAARTAIAHAETEQATDEQRAFFEAAFADTLAIYMLSLAMDLDYADLREREYPLLAAPALADRLRLAAELYPPATGYEFSIRYRRRH